MVPRSSAACQTPAWRQDLLEAYRDADDLLAKLCLTRREIPDLDCDPPVLRMLVPRGFADLMKPRDPHDPLLRQVLPLASERCRIAGFSQDPVDDESANRGDGLLRKYEGRALMLVTGACAIHCRYCFRRHFPYSALGAAGPRTSAALARIAADRQITELILSGGDPLMVDDQPLAELVERLEGIAHLKGLRIHSRLPVVLPRRVTRDLCDLLGASRFKVLVVIHANHPDELGGAAETALLRLRGAGVHLLNQSVLLRGINDTAEILRALSERLFDCGTLPYYLHQLDPVEGAAHFEVSDAYALQLMHALRSQVPGYLVPRLVREIPGADSKIPLLG
ncbi:MAG: EF-P beta-lysylation protein EpmB [Thiocapsa sp.]|jgi:EF-P beta-lysylation protein EpmB|nr:EF-P beta-lysylation protein EpmB [Thiocapsa sp.]MCG6896485.1 EF-P beta-lysylation protein EpmB [Thiocapsa sp.]MCG6985326.1 EF-P beta-lysylation protein EpmB [Thiocapsa sp.]